MKRSVRDLLRQKNFDHFPFVKPGATLKEALTVLSRYNAGSLLVMNQGNLEGVFSERDLARESLNDGGIPRMDTRIETLMVRRVIYVTLDYSLEECLAVMAKMQVRHLPVIDGEKVAALLGMRHITEALIEEQEFLNGELVRYMTGSNHHKLRLPPAVLVRGADMKDSRALTANG